MGLATPTVTGYSEFWGGANQYSMLRARSNVVKRAAQLLSRDRAIRAALDAYINSGATPAISDTYKRVVAVQDTTGTDLGGARSIETVTIVSDTGDSTIAGALDDIVDSFFDVPITYASDASGNGGGGKNGF